MDIEMSLQYLAGLFDGEGTISIHRHSKNEKHFSLVLYITNTNKTVFDAIQSKYGGNIQDKQSRTRKKCYSINWRGLEAKNIIKLIISYSIIKRNELLLGLDFPVGEKNKKLTPEIIRERQMLYAKLHVIRYGC